MQLIGNPLTKLAVFLLFELWLVVQVTGSPLLETEWVKSYVHIVGSVIPVVHHFDRVANNASEVRLILAISPVLLIPKIIFWVQWLNSDRIRNFRYFVISPLTTSVPKSPVDFVTDPLRSGAENKSPERLQPISKGRAIFISLATLVLAAMIGVLWPWFVYGSDIAKDRAADFREIAVAQGGWKFWLAWSVYQMNLSAGALAIGYCVLAEYFRWFRNLLIRT